jgi:hypothetical protein
MTDTLELARQRLAAIRAGEPRACDALSQTYEENEEYEESPVLRATPPVPHFDPTCLECHERLAPDRLYFCEPCAMQRFADIQDGRRRA